MSLLRRRVTASGSTWGRMLAAANKWNKESLAQIRATPWSLHVQRDTAVVFKEKKDAKQQDFKDKITVARQVYIKASDLAEFGLTTGCPKCDHEISYGPGRSGKPHSDMQCRRGYLVINTQHDLVMKHKTQCQCCRSSQFGSHQIPSLCCHATHSFLHTLLCDSMSSGLSWCDLLELCRGIRACKLENHSTPSNTFQKHPIAF